MAEARRRGSRRLRWTLYLLIVLAVAGMGLFAMNRFVRRTRVTYQKGMIYLRNKDFAAALAAFERVLEMDSHHVPARIGIATAHAARREYGLAQDALLAAREVGADEKEVALLRAQFMAEEAAYRLHVEGTTPAVIQDVLAQCIDPAVKILTEAASRSDQPVHLFHALGALYAQKRDILGSRSEILRQEKETLAKAGKDDLSAEKHREWMVAEQARYMTDDESIRAFSRAIESDPKAAPPRLALASHWLMTYVPRTAVAKALLAPILEENPKDLAALHLMAVADRAERRYQEALDRLKGLGEEADRSPALQRFKIEVILDAQSVETAALTPGKGSDKPVDENWLEASRLCEALAPQAAKDPIGAYLIGRVLLERKQAEQALGYLQNALAVTEGATPGGPAWPEARFALAKALEATGRTEQAITAHNDALRDVSTVASRPRSSIRRVLILQNIRFESSRFLAEALRRGFTDRAAAHARTALALRPALREVYELARSTAIESKADADALVSLVGLHAQGILAATRDPARALELVQREMRSPEFAACTDRLASLAAALELRQGDYQKAAQQYERAYEASGDRQALYNLAALHARLGRMDKAREAYEEALRKYPGDLRAVAGVAALRMKEGDLEGARRLLLGEGAAAGRSAQDRQAVIRLAAAMGWLAEAAQLAERQCQVAPHVPENHVLLAEILWQQARTDEARAAFDRAIALGLEEHRTTLRALLDFEMGRFDDATALLEKVHERYPQDLNTLGLLVVALQATSKAEAAHAVLQRALEAERLRGQAPPDLLPWYMAVLEAARGEAAKARAWNETVQLPRMRLGAVRERAALLDRLAAIPDAEARSRAATALNLIVLFANSGRQQAARRQLETLGSPLADEALPHCWVAVLGKAGSAAPSSEELARIVEAHPDSVFARFALADVLLRSGQAERAVPALEEALGYCGPDEVGMVHLLLGHSYEKLGRLDEATESYLAASEYPSVALMAFNDLAYLTATLKNDPAAALPLAEKAQQAAERVRLRVPHISDTLGWVHYLLGDNAKALPLLEEARRHLPGEPSVRFHLAMAYLKAGRIDEARSELTEALGLSTSFPEADEANRVLGGI